MELKTYTCPNCGAQITNTENCEYCGSLLVRFEAKGIQTSNMSAYLDDSSILPGLLNELKENLRLQKNNQGAITDISLPIRRFKDGGNLISRYSVISTKDVVWGDGSLAFPDAKNEPGLAIIVHFPRYDGDEDQEYYKFTKKQHSKFKKMECFNLFTHRTIQDREEGDMVDEYMINFGADAEGAAHLLSDILRELEECNNDTDITYDTNTGDIIAEHRKKFDEEHDTSINWFTIFGIVFCVIVFLYRCAG